MTAEFLYNRFIARIAELERQKELIAKWREDAIGASGERSYDADILRDCAGDLEKLISAPLAAEADVDHIRQAAAIQRVDQMAQLKAERDQLRRELAISLEGCDERNTRVAELEEEVRQLQIESAASKDDLSQRSSELESAKAEIQGVKLAAGWGKDDTRPADSAALELCNEIMEFKSAKQAAERERDEANVRCGEWATKAGEAKGMLEASKMAGTVQGWKERALAAELRAEAFRKIVVVLVALFYVETH